MVFNLFSGFSKKKDVEKIKNQYINQEISFLDFTKMFGTYTGDKTNYFSGFGETRDLTTYNLKLLQYRSIQLFRENGYASAAVKRLLTKTINQGLTLRSHPLESILLKYIDEGTLDSWGDTVENLFYVWSRDKRLVSKNRQATLQQLERQCFLTALLSGDCLVIMNLNKMGLPVIELVDGINISTPPIKIIDKNIEHGVEFDSNGNVTAYYVEVIENGFTEHKRVEAYTSKGQLKAWLVKVNDSRIDEKRGLPLFSVIMQNLNEIGKYLDSEQRAALVNSYIAVVHARGEENVGSADHFVRAGKNINNPDTDSTMKFKQMQPGYFATNLAYGETITSFSTDRPNVNFSKFADSVLKTVSYSLEIPPEVYFLEFNSNYSASRQAILSMEELTKKLVSVFSSGFNQPIYEAWLDGMVLQKKIAAKLYLESLFDLTKFEILGAWRACTWRGLPKSNADGLKQAKELEIVKKNNWLTDEEICDEYYNSDFKTNLRIARAQAEKVREINDILYPQEVQ